jgi:hypothetical protein
MNRNYNRAAPAASRDRERANCTITASGGKSRPLEGAERLQPHTAGPPAARFGQSGPFDLSDFQLADQNRASATTVICGSRDIADASADQMVGVTVGNEKLDECVLFADRDAASHRKHRVTAKMPPSRPRIWGRRPSRGLRTWGKAAENLLLQ